MCGAEGDLRKVSPSTSGQERGLTAEILHVTGRCTKGIFRINYTASLFPDNIRNKHLAQILRGSLTYKATI